MLIGVYVKVSRAPRAFGWARVVRMLALPLNFLFNIEAIVTIEVLALWFRSNAQRYLHDQLHGPTRSF